MKNKYIVLSLLLISSMLIFGYSSFYVKNDKGTNKSLSMIEDPETEILGFWVLENDSSTKIEFTIDGYIKTYVNDQLEYSDIYQITNTCDGNTSTDNLLFLKITDSEDSDVTCSIIANGVYDNNSNFLTLITEVQGKIVTYVRQ